MKKIPFEEGVEIVLLQDERYCRDAYYFLRDALDHAVRTCREKETGAGLRHVTPRQLLMGLREHGLEQFGPMTLTVFEEWGVRTCLDVGNMVFNMIEVGSFGKTENDRLEDFDHVYDFRQAFLEPFLPVRLRRPALPPPPENFRHKRDEQRVE